MDYDKTMMRTELTRKKRTVIAKRTMEVKMINDKYISVDSSHRVPDWKLK